MSTLYFEEFILYIVVITYLRNYNEFMITLDDSKLGLYFNSLEIVNNVSIVT